MGSKRRGGCYTSVMILCVDTGGTKTLVAAFTANKDGTGHLGAVHRFPTPRTPKEYVAKLSTLVVHEYDLFDAEAIALGIPGEIADNKITWCTNLPWKDFDLAGILARKLKFPRPIVLENDVNLAGLGEANALEPVPRTVMYLTVSTGINANIVENGRLIPALNRNEAGHMVIEYKGNVLEWETLASGRTLYKDYGKYARDIHDPAVWHEVAEKISRGLLDLIPMFQPDVLVFGGGVGAYFERFGTDLAAILDATLHAHLIRPRLLKARHPEQAVLYGGFVSGTDAVRKAAAGVAA